MTTTAADTTVQTLAEGVTLIDTGMVRVGMAACYLLERNGRYAVVETGTRHTVPAIMAQLQAQQVAPEQVDYVIPTHVHLDHAGGVGLLMQQLPGARLVIHPRGARHMLDPTRLQAGATEVYGQEAYQEMYGDLLPVEAGRMVVAEDGDSLLLGGERLEFLDTPGHARHHFCVWDDVSRGFFTGDTFGIAYRELVVDGRPFIFPTSSPVQFDPPALKQSIGKLLAKRPQRMYLTHYGMVTEPDILARSLLEQIDDYVSLTRQLQAQLAPGEELADVLLPRLTDYTLQRAIAHGCEASLTAETIAFDMALNVQGLVIWAGQQAASA